MAKSGSSYSKTQFDLSNGYLDFSDKYCFRTSTATDEHRSFSLNLNLYCRMTKEDGGAILELNNIRLSFRDHSVTRCLNFSPEVISSSRCHDQHPSISGLRSGWISYKMIR